NDASMSRVRNKPVSVSVNLADGSVFVKTHAGFVDRGDPELLDAFRSNEQFATGVLVDNFKLVANLRMAAQLTVFNGLFQIEGVARVVPLFDHCAQVVLFDTQGCKRMGNALYP